MNLESKNPLLFRISILGDEGIGKEKFISAFTSNQFLKESDTGLGVAFYKGNLMIDTLHGQQECIIWIWDLKEREGYISLHSRYLKGTNGIMLFFDLTNRESFNKIPKWIENIENSSTLDTPILLVGNRPKSQKLKVSPYEVSKIVREFNLFYIETSLTAKEGIHDSFYCITSLTLGIEVDQELFLTKNIIFYPGSISTPKNVSPPLTPQDLSNLGQKMIFKKIESLEKTFEKSKKIKIPLKMLIFELILSIGVLTSIITVHFLHTVHRIQRYAGINEGVSFPFPWVRFNTIDVISSFYILTIIMQIAVIIPIVFNFIKRQNK
ncbi:MAG: hypothetical protein ACFFDB_20235 [Promethearchaeota archaeon]